MRQISANMSLATGERLEHYVRSRGLTKGFVIEQALVHHLAAVDALPDEIVVPVRLTVTRESGERVLERLAANEGPNAAMRALFDGQVSDEDP